MPLAGESSDDPMAAFDFYSIGHSNIPAERFVAIAARGRRGGDCRCALDAVLALLPVVLGQESQAAVAAKRHRLSALWRCTRRPSARCPSFIAMVLPTMRRWRGSAIFKPGSTRLPLRRSMRIASSPHLPDVRGTRAARLPPLSPGGARARRARLYRRPYSVTTARSSRMRRPNGGLLELDGDDGRPLRNWTERANSGSVSPPRPRRGVSGDAHDPKRTGRTRSAQMTVRGEVGRRELTMRTPVLAVLIVLGAGSGSGLCAGHCRAGAGAGYRHARSDAARHAQSAAVAAACQSECAVDAGQGTVRPRADAVSRSGAPDRLLCRRLPRRRRGAADHRPGLASHAAVAQPQLGNALADPLHRAARRQCQESRLERPSDRRHVAAARRPDDHRPRQPSDRARRRHLVHADARSRAQPRGARDGRRRRYGRAGSARRRSESVDAHAHRADPHRVGGSRTSPASSSMPRSRRRCAARPDRIAPGSQRCGRGGAMPSTFMSVSPARRTTANASRSRRCRKATAAAMRSISGSRNRRCIRRRRKCRPKPKPALTLAGLPAACKQIVMAP